MIQSWLPLSCLESPHTPNTDCKKDDWEEEQVRCNLMKRSNLLWPQLNNYQYFVRFSAHIQHWYHLPASFICQIMISNLAWISSICRCDPSCATNLCTLLFTSIQLHPGSFFTPWASIMLLTFATSVHLIPYSCGPCKHQAMSAIPQPQAQMAFCW